MSTDLLRKHRYSLVRSLLNIEEDIAKIDSKRKRILYITPHLSTGGMPQYLLKKIEIMSRDADVYCIQWVDNAPLFDVQKKKIKEFLGDRFFCLGEDKGEVISLILDKIYPDIIHFEDIPERFISKELNGILYGKYRPYMICETPHSSTIGPAEKIFLPDKFVMVNQWMVEKYKVLPCQFDILEYPIESVAEYKKEDYIEKLGLDPKRKHIINVGLFTPGKNQAEVIRIANSLSDYPIDFHFIGNMAGNFIEYWKPLTENLPINCKIWGEREDVSDFYKAADLFLFTSNWELSPIVIRESISNRLPIMLYKLPSYMNDYDNMEYINYVRPFEYDENLKSILDIIGL